MTFRLMMTCTGGGLAAQNIRLAQAIKRVPVEVVAVDNNPLASSRLIADVFEPVPRGDEPGYVDAVCDIVARHKVDLIMPGSDEEALALAEGRERIAAAGAQVAVADSATLRSIIDKAATYDILKSAGLPVADYIQVADRDSLDKAVDYYLARYGECVIKPSTARGGRGVFVLRNDIKGVEPVSGARELHMPPALFKRDYLDEAASALPAVVCERLLGPTWDADILTWKGELLQVVTRRRLNPAVPNDGHVILRQDELVDIAGRIAKLFNLSWLYDFDVMFGADGRPRVIEVNPRPSGSTSVAVSAGCPLFEELVGLALGEPPAAKVTIADGTRVVPYTALAVLP